MTDTPPTNADTGTDARTAELAERLAAVHARIDAARGASGRDDTVELVVVTKFHPAADVARLARLGVTRVGENRVQEAAAKVPEVADLLEADSGEAVPPRWDMIGRLQSNKAAAVTRWADRVQSADSRRVVDGLDRGRARKVDEGRTTGPLPVLLQLSLDADPARGGVTVADLPALADHIAGLAHLRLDGLMVVPPLEGEAARHLAAAAVVRDRLVADHPGATVFSAGMSGDLEEAVAAGSTCVRVGTAILGPRPIP